MVGIINSFQSLGAVDGPGLRYVIFMQGCPLRCIYCHNPDTWDLDGEEYSVDEVFQRILRYKPYFSENGGVTFSGGEPLLQWKFVAELFCLLQQAGLHTALDTSGIGDLIGAEEVLKYTNVVLCDLKFSNEEKYLQNCKGDMKQVISFLKLTERMQIPLWVRHVVIPGITDSKANILKIAQLAKGFSNLRKLELLPFKKLCISKYQALGMSFPLADYEECPDSLINELYQVIDSM